MLKNFQNVANIAETLKNLQMLQCFQNVANIEEPLKMLQSVAELQKKYCKDFKMLQMLQCFQNAANVAEFRKMLKCCRNFLKNVANVADDSICARLLIYNEGEKSSISILNHSKMLTCIG